MLPGDGKSSDEEVDSVGESADSDASGSSGSGVSEVGVLPVSLDTETSALVVMVNASLVVLCGIFATVTEGTTDSVHLGYFCIQR
jgi:hypothetical protein